MRSKLGTGLWSIAFLYFGLSLKSSCAQKYHDRNSCQLPKGIDSCVDIWQCQPLVDLLKTFKKPHHPEATNKLGVYICCFCNQLLKVCCPPEPIIFDSETPYHNREEAPDVENHKNIHLLPTDCGIIQETERITNGYDDHLNEFPWMALLQYKSLDKSSYVIRFVCGGTIVNSKYILTAAHCVVRSQGELVGVRVGEHSILNRTDCEIQDNLERTVKCNPPVQDLRIEKIISHPQYTLTNAPIYDIALLRVSGMKLGDNVYLVCLPLGALRDWEFRSVIVAGWKLRDRITHKIDLLQKVAQLVIDKKTCASIYNESGIELTKTQMCTKGRQGKPFCAGDSGGPMLIPGFSDNNFIYFQYGITSFGPKSCGQNSSLPIVYTVVKFYMDWILDNIAP